MILSAVAVFVNRTLSRCMVRLVSKYLNSEPPGDPRRGSYLPPPTTRISAGTNTVPFYEPTSLGPETSLKNMAYF